MSRRHFLRISTQLDISEIQTTAESIETSMRMKIRHAIASARRGKLEFSIAFGVWLERRAELGKVNCRVEFYKNYSLKLSRYAEDEECNAYAILRNRIKASQDSKRKVLSSIGENLRALCLLRFRRATTRTEVWNRQEYEFSARNVVVGLNYNESAALTDAHVKSYKF